MTQASRFRALLHREGMVIAPGAYDCITAKLIEQAGFSAVYMTGAGTAATLGYPDFGLVTMSEMVGNAGRIATAVEVPVIADADTGYGNELNVFRTVREFERSGVFFKRNLPHGRRDERHAAEVRDQGGHLLGTAAFKCRDGLAAEIRCGITFRAHRFVILNCN